VDPGPLIFEKIPNVPCRFSEEGCGAASCSLPCPFRGFRESLVAFGEPTASKAARVVAVAERVEGHEGGAYAVEKGNQEDPSGEL
jgi:hypothetical protein